MINFRKLATLEADANRGNERADGAEKKIRYYRAASFYSAPVPESSNFSPKAYYCSVTSYIDGS
jgi:hypothetical protein